MHTFPRNFRYGVRGLRRRPGMTLAIIATLLIGIGATTAIYTVVYAVLIAPLPYPNAGQLMVVWSFVNGHRNGVSAGDFLDWQRQNSSFQQLAAWNGSSFNVATQDQPQQLQGRLTSPGWFDMQGIPMFLGRDFLPEEGIPGKNHVVVLTHRLWNEFGADRSIVGRTMQVDGAPHTVVGVLAPGLADRLGFEMAAPLAFTPTRSITTTTGSWSWDASSPASPANRRRPTWTPSLRALPPRIPNPTPDGALASNR